MFYNFVADGFRTRNFVADFLRAKSTFRLKTAVWRFAAPLVGLGTV